MDLGTASLGGLVGCSPCGDASRRLVWSRDAFIVSGDRRWIARLMSELWTNHVPDRRRTATYRPQRLGEMAFGECSACVRVCVYVRACSCVCIQKARGGVCPSLLFLLLMWYCCLESSLSNLSMHLSVNLEWLLRPWNLQCWRLVYNVNILFTLLTLCASGFCSVLFLPWVRCKIFLSVSNVSVKLKKNPRCSGKVNIIIFFY